MKKVFSLHLYSACRSKRLLTDEGSNILVYMTGHGGDGFLKFQVILFGHKTNKTCRSIGRWVANLMGDGVSKFGRWVSELLGDGVFRFGRWVAKLLGDRVSKFGRWVVKLLGDGVYKFGRWVAKLLGGRWGV